MKSRTSAILCSVILIFNILTFGTVAFAEENTACTIADGISAYQMRLCGAGSVQEWIDTGLAENAGVASEWFVIALHQSGTNYDYSKYSSALAGYLKSGGVYSAATMEKYALAFLSANCACDYVDKVMSECIGSGGIMSCIFGLHLMTNGQTSPSRTADSVVTELISLQHGDGGYGLSERSDVDVTAMTLQALAPYYETSESVRSTVDRALDFLSKEQLPDGSFSSYGTVNSESISQVIIAMSALGIKNGDARFVKGATALDALISFRLPDGSFSHVSGGETSSIATAEAYMAAIASIRAENGGNGIYILDEYPDNTPDGIPSFLDKDVAAEEKEPVGYKVWAIVAVVAAAVVVSAVLIAFGKRSIKNHVFVLCVAAVLAAIIVLTDIESASSYYGGGTKVRDPVGTVAMSVECYIIDGKPGAPDNCLIMPEKEIEIEDGDTVYSVLVRAAKANGILIENNGSRKLAYISGISGLYELEYGELSGWIYTVNGVIASVTCSEYILSDGDVIGWHYTLDLGRDISG